jgi:hypothetical protein
MSSEFYSYHKFTGFHFGALQGQPMMALLPFQPNWASTACDVTITRTSGPDRGDVLLHRALGLSGFYIVKGEALFPKDGEMGLLRRPWTDQARRFKRRMNPDGLYVLDSRVLSGAVKLPHARHDDLVAGDQFDITLDDDTNQGAGNAITVSVEVGEKTEWDFLHWRRVTTSWPKIQILANVLDRSQGE